jgi:hypothetical protein
MPLAMLELDTFLRSTTGDRGVQIAAAGSSLLVYSNLLENPIKHYSEMA